MSKEDKINQIKQVLTECKHSIENYDFVINFTFRPKYIDINKEIKMQALEPPAEAYRLKPGTQEEWEKQVPETAYVIHKKIKEVLKNPDITVKELDNILSDICKETKDKDQVYGPGVFGTTGSTAQLYGQIHQSANNARKGNGFYIRSEQESIELITKK